MLRKQEEMLKKIPLLSHWEMPDQSDSFGRIRGIVFNVLCITSFGEADLERVWTCIKLHDDGDESVWNDGIRKMIDRWNNILVVVRRPTIHVYLTY